jgi:hypothetical protein
MAPPMTQSREGCGGGGASRPGLPLMTSSQSAVDCASLTSCSSKNRDIALTREPGSGAGTEASGVAADGVTGGLAASAAPAGNEGTFGAG